MRVFWSVHHLSWTVWVSQPKLCFLSHYKRILHEIGSGNMQHWATEHTQAHTNTHTHTQTHTHTHTPRHTETHRHTHTHTHTHTPTQTDTLRHTYTQTPPHTHTHTHQHTPKHIDTPTQTHTHTHTHFSGPMSSLVRPYGMSLFQSAMLQQPCLGQLDFENCPRIKHLMRLLQKCMSGCNSGVPSPLDFLNFLQWIFPFFLQVCCVI